MAANDVEHIKESSRQLRGSIPETLASDASHFCEADYQLLKFHGSYQQDDRDLRAQRKRENLDKAWMFMVRTKQPGGNILASQYLALDRLAGEIANGTLRITNRQGIQFHGILKTDMRDAMRRIHASGLTTWGACGDVVRNTMGPAAPIRDEAHLDAHRLARELSDTFLAKSTAYTEIWLDGKKLEEPFAPVDEPIYGSHYLPRKFKIGIAVPPRNDTDIFTQDIGFVAHAPAGKLEGYTLTVGGGFGMSHGQIKTYPCLGQPLFYVRREDAVAAAVAIVSVQRDHGDRTDRKHARMKYLVAERGIDWFRQQVCARLDAPVEEAKPIRFTTVGDLLGWHEQGDGKLFCGIPVEVGRIRDIEGGPQYRTAFRRMAERFDLPMRLTPNTNLILCDVEPSLRTELDALLAEHHVPLADGFTEARKTAHACVALPTCGLALSESERFFPGLMDRIDGILRELGLEKEPILIRMTGCPNGCARPYNADLAFVGRAPGKYAFYAGGSITGDRLVGLEQKTVEAEAIPDLIRPILAAFASERTAGETFSGWWKRTRPNGDAPHPDQFHVELAERAARLQSQKAEAPEA